MFYVLLSTLYTMFSVFDVNTFLKRVSIRRSQRNYKMNYHTNNKMANEIQSLKLKKLIFLLTSKK